jgi:hypothetical protein
VVGLEVVHLLAKHGEPKVLAQKLYDLQRVTQPRLVPAVAV